MSNAPADAPTRPDASHLDLDAGGELKGDWLALEGDPLDGGLGADLVVGDGAARGCGGTGGNGDGHGHGTRVSVGADRDGGDGGAVGGKAVGQRGLTIVEGLTVEEVLGDVVVLEGDDGPVGEAGHLLGDGLGPGHEEGHLGRLGADGHGGPVRRPHICLVEHVGVGLQAEEVAGVVCLCECQQVSEVALAGGRVDPLLGGALGGVAVIVDSRGVPGDDSQASVAVALNSRGKRVVLALGVPEDRAGVVADNAGEARVHPSLDNVAVVHSGNCGRNEALGREGGGLGDAELLHPGLVELDLALGVVVRGVVELHVRESVRHVHEGVELGGRAEPLGEGVALGAGEGPRVGSELGGPAVGAGTEGLLVLERGGGGIVVLDGVVGNAGGVVDGGCVLDVPVAVVAELDLEAGAGGQPFVEVSHPCDVGVQVGRGDLVRGPSGVVHVGLELDIVDLGAHVRLALAQEDAAGHPVDVGVLEVVGGGRPRGRPAGKPDKLLAAAGELVHDGSNRVGRVAAAGAELGNLRRGRGVGDDGRVVPQTLAGDAGVAGKVSDVYFISVSTEQQALTS